MTRFRLRAERAGLLAERYPASRESLRFFAAVSLYQDSGEGLDALRDLARVEIPEESAWFQRIQREMRSPESPATPPKTNECPQCGSSPQLAVLRPLADGTSFSLACSICRHEWQFPRTQCPSCGESGPDKIQFARTEDALQKRLKGHTPFADTIAELRKDRACLQRDN
ncbi:MAG: formate dehydrogenase accessory protein FdhE [Candidatus Solibacter usitatus]|nr:formate dehydrogenase accessory protein FdhE [Candidatus Solibacter usitatus]